MKDRATSIGVVASILLVMPSPMAFAEAPKKGRVLCEGTACREVNVPTGSTVGVAWEVIQDLKSRVVQRVGPAEPEKVEAKPAKSTKIRPVTEKGGRPQDRGSPTVSELDSNLPVYYAGVDRREFEASERVIFVPKSHDPKLKGLKTGDVVWAVVEQEITASPGVPTPVRAIATTGPFKGAYFVGEATLDRELKRVLFNFNKLRVKSHDAVYELKASGLSPGGSIGLDGEYVSQTGRFFIAELASATAAGFVDATISRSQSALGTYVQEPSLSNSGKTAAVTALSKTTDRMAEAVRQAPEYTHLKGYQEIQIIIQDDPAESGV